MCHGDKPRHVSPEWLFRELNHSHRYASDAVLALYGIKEVGQPMILFILEHDGKNGSVSTQKELADRMGISPSTVTISLKSLERQGCIRKICDEKDMRRNRIEITEKGRQVAHQYHEAFWAIDRAMYDGFTAEEREQISDLYRKMIDNLHKLQTQAESGNLPSERK